MAGGRCGVCGADGLLPILDLGAQPPANALSPIPDTDAPRFPLELVVCQGCALAQLAVSLPPEDLFTDYVYFSSYSPTVVANAHAHVDALVSQEGLGAGDLVVEIASNDGYLLRRYQHHGVDVLGVDPAVNVAAEANRRGIPTVCAFFDQALAGRLREEGVAARIVHANNVLAHVPDPVALLRGAGELLTPDGRLIVEVPYVVDLVERVEFDTIYHEHRYYFSLTALSRLATRAGLEIVDVERIAIHGGSLRVSFRPADTAVVPSAQVSELLAAERRAGVDGAAYFADFGDRVRALLDRLRELLTAEHDAGHRIAGYGAAAKATVMIHALGGIATELAFVADRSPHKQGRYVPGTAIPVVTPDELYQRRPELCVVFAWNYADEITRDHRAYIDGGGRFVIPVPAPSVVGVG